MRERLKKVTVEQIRTLYLFDAVTLAVQIQTTGTTKKYWELEVVH